MLDVIGAGATASSAQDWHSIWQNSSESANEQKQLQRIHEVGRGRGAVKATFTSTYATSWMQQTTSLLKRDFLARWRDVCFPLDLFTLPFFDLDLSQPISCRNWP
jgi:ATP-binding cassette subfamily G (WHITE) protein 2 (SNQ2)